MIDTVRCRTRGNCPQSCTRSYCFDIVQARTLSTALLNCFIVRSSKRLPQSRPKKQTKNVRKANAKRRNPSIVFLSNTNLLSKRRNPSTGFLSDTNMLRHNYCQTKDTASILVPWVWLSGPLGKREHGIAPARTGPEHVY